MKKNYIKPITTVVRIESETQLLSGSQPVSAVESNADISYGGGSTQAARVKGNTVDWDNWE